MLTPAHNHKPADSYSTQSANAPERAADTAKQAANPRAELGAKIMQASYEVSLQSGNDSMALLYRTAIENINTHLAPELGPNALQNAMHQDNSPEATAERILSQSTAFFDGYAKQHPNKDPETALRDFVDLVRKGFEQGYNEAVEILSGLGVMGEDSTVAAEIGKTFSLVQQGYDDFLQTRLDALAQKTADTGANSSQSED